MATVINEFEVVPEPERDRGSAAQAGQAGGEHGDEKGAAERERQIEKTIRLRQARSMRRVAF